MNKSRLEAFSDGVFAIVLTIMVLELHAPASAEPSALLALAPALLSYALSFLYVGIYWTNHHHLFQLADRVNLRVLWANLHLLFWLSLLPFATAWIAGHHRDMAPVAAYGLILLMCSVSFLVLKLTLRASESIHPEAARILGQGRKNNTSILLYALAILLSQWAPLIASAIYAALAIVWLLPTRTATAAPQA